MSSIVGSYCYGKELAFLSEADAVWSHTVCF